MPAIRAMWIVASVALSGMLSASAQQLSTTVQTEYDLICQEQAGQNGIEEPLNWVWSDDDELCEPDALNSNSPSDLQAVESGVEDTVGDLGAAAGDAAGTIGLRSAKFRRDAQATQACDEGMSTCLQNCSDYDIKDYQGGGSGAWVGCRASCSYRCSSAKGGCWKGYCWAGCSTGFPIVEGNEWCYTTTSYSQSYQYVSCSANNQCDKTWKCGGPCAAF